MLKNLTDYSRTSGVIHWQGERKWIRCSTRPGRAPGISVGRGGETLRDHPDHMAAPVRPAGPVRCTPGVMATCRGRPSAVTSSSVDIFNQNFCDGRGRICPPPCSFRSLPQTFGSRLRYAQGTRKCPLVKVRVSLVGTWSPSRFFNHDSAGRL